MKPTGEMDSGTLIVRYGDAELDPFTHGWRHREFWIWRENGVKCGSWVWRPGIASSVVPRHATSELQDRP